MSQLDSPTEMIQVKKTKKTKKVKEIVKKDHFLTTECETFKTFIHTKNLIKKVVILIFP